jgi:hypothetical protein
MSKFKLEFTLKQHTPIIHFQSDQAGATLRATELKPKLDRFLIEAFEKEGIDYKDFLIAGQERALDYKVSITPDLSSAETIETIDSRGREQSNPLFFGNMGDGEYKKFKHNKNSIKLTLFSYKSELVKYLDDKFEAFLANTNFGTRQSKGFGSFYLNRPFNKSLVNHKVYSFTVNANGWEEDIKHFYSFLRAGINTANYRGIYAKAVIFAYAKSKGITWDKKAIKNFYLDGNPNIENEKLMRDLFGLSSTQSWMSYRATITKDDPTKEVARFKSPITFKPIVEGKNIRIYFWADKSVEDILNREFVINFDRKKGLKLKTPNEFSFDEFFDFAFNLDLSKYIDSDYHNNRQYTKLVNMFKEIKESK